MSASQAGSMVRPGQEAGIGFRPTEEQLTLQRAVAAFIRQEVMPHEAVVYEPEAGLFDFRYLEVAGPLFAAYPRRTAETESGV